MSTYRQERGLWDSQAVHTACIWTWVVRNRSYSLEPKGPSAQVTLPNPTRSYRFKNKGRAIWLTKIPSFIGYKHLHYERKRERFHYIASADLRERKRLESELGFTSSIRIGGPGIMKFRLRPLLSRCYNLIFGWMIRILLGWIDSPLGMLSPFFEDI